MALRSDPAWTDDDGTNTTGTIVGNDELAEILDYVAHDAQTTTLTGNQDDFDLSVGVGLLRCNNASAVVLRGIAITNAFAGQRVVIVSIGAGTVDLNHEDTNSTAANRLLTDTGSAVQLGAGTGKAEIVYDGDSARWRVLWDT